MTNASPVIFSSSNGGRDINTDTEDMLRESAKANTANNTALAIYMGVLLLPVAGLIAITLGPPIVLYLLCGVTFDMRKHSENEPNRLKQLNTTALITTVGMTVALYKVDAMHDILKKAMDATVAHISEGTGTDLMTFNAAITFSFIVGMMAQCAVWAGIEAKDQFSKNRMRM